MYKKIAIIFLFISLFFTPVHAASNNKVLLNGDWLINLNDNSDFSKEKVDESQWLPDSFKLTSSLFIPNRTNRSLWARNHFSVPSSLKNDDLMLYVGDLNNGHEIYINGILVGKSPLFPNQFFNEWDTKYYYTIPQNLLHYDEDNVISIKTYSSFEYGYGDEIFIAPYNDVLNKVQFSNSISIYLYFGFDMLVFSTFLYFLFMYIKKHVSKVYLYFSLMCLCASVYYLNFIVYKLPISYLLFQKIIFISMNIFIILALPFIKELLNMEFNSFEKKLCYVLGTVSIIGNLFSMTLLNQYIFRTIFIIPCAAMILYYFILTVKTIFSRFDERKRMAACIFVSFLLIMHDLIYQFIGAPHLISFQFNGVALIILVVPVAHDLFRDYNKLYFKAFTDGLTGLFNQIYIKNMLAQAVTRKSNEFYTLIMFDIDDFKKFNDNYGHLIGDLVLRTTADTIKQVIPPNAIAARYGGEEFAILISGIAPRNSQLLAEKIRSSVEKQRCSDDTGQRFSITISLGITTWSTNSEHNKAEDFIHEADKALYKSKEDGKNRVTLYSDIK